MVVDAARVATILGGRKVLGRRVATITDLMQAVEDGLPRQALDVVTRRVAGRGHEAIELRHRVVPKATLARRGQTLSMGESERLERLARLFAFAEQVWEDEELAREFMTSPQPQLDGRRPVDLIRTDLGTRRVEQLLSALEYALPA